MVLTNTQSAALKALRVIIDDENEPARLEDGPRHELASEEQRDVVQRAIRVCSIYKASVVRPLIVHQHDANDGNVKKEKESSVIKSERIKDDETYEDDELTILETRSVKRRRLDAEVIVLD